MRTVWILAAALAACAQTAWREPPEKRTPSPRAAQLDVHTVQFPLLTAEDLNGDSQEIPNGLPGELKLFMIAYERGQQADLEPWQAAAARLERAHPRFRAYGLPTLAARWSFARSMIEGGLRRTHKTHDARARILTLYIDKDRFNSALGLTSQGQVHVLLVDTHGTVVWYRGGRPDADALADLSAEVDTRLPEGRGGAL